MPEKVMMRFLLPLAHVFCIFFFFFFFTFALVMTAHIINIAFAPFFYVVGHKARK